MKIILITSDITYVPQNYNDVLENVIKASRGNIAGIVLVKINPVSIVGKIIFLYCIGCFNMANSLLNNLASMLTGRKAALLKKFGIPFLTTKDVHDSRAISWLRNIEPDLIFNMRARCIYKKELLEIPQLACVNIHHGIMPLQKGLFCDLYAIERNVDTGFSIHEMTEKIDQGRIFYKEVVAPDKNYVAYLKKVSSRESAAITNFIKSVMQMNLLPKGSIDSSDQPITTTTPDYKTIKRLQQNKIIL